MTEFSQALSKYRKVLTPEAIAEPYYGLAVAVMDRWANDADREKLWRTLVAKLRHEDLPTPLQFIDMVVSRRLLAARLEEIENELPTEVQKARARIKRNLTEGSFDKVAIEATLVDNVCEPRSRVLGRQKGGFRRRYFSLGFSDKFQELCGTPLDDVVGAITRIAFGDHGIVVKPQAGKTRQQLLKHHDEVQEVRDTRRRAYRDTRRQK